LYFDHANIGATIATIFALAASIMNSLQTQNKKRKIYWILTSLVILGGLLFALMNLSEYYNSKFEHQKSAYPFGNINESPWYYQSASVYEIYSLTLGLLFIATSIITSFGVAKRNNRILTIGILSIILLLLGQLLSARIQ
jgi:hypothetical protein